MASAAIGFFLVLFVLILTQSVGPVSAVQPGVRAIPYRNTGTWATPVFTPLTLVRDETDGATWETPECGSKDTLAKEYAKTRLDLIQRTQIRADPQDAGYNAVADAAEAQALFLDIMFLDGPLTQEGCRGYRADWLVQKTGKPKMLDGVVVVDFEFKPAAGSINGHAKSVKMGPASSPVFTPI